MPTNQPPTSETKIQVIVGDTVLTGRLPALNRIYHDAAHSSHLLLPRIAR